MMTNHCGYQASCLLLLSSLLLCASSARAQQAGDARDLVPVLAFGVDRSVVLGDIAVTGSFPQSFRLGDLPEPPWQAMIDVSMFAPPYGPFTYAIGHIAAVPRDHPPALRATKGGFEKQDCTASACTDRVRVCSADEKACTSATLTCNRVGKDCKITSIDGDPELLRQSLYLFEGRARDVELLYIEDPAPAGSMLSQLYAGGAAIEPGYHLMEQRGSAEEAQAKMARCEVRSEQNVLKRYSQELGVSFESDSDFFEYLTLKHFNERHGTHHDDLSDIRNPDLLDNDELKDLMFQLQRAFMNRMMWGMIARGCMVDPAGFTVVGAPDSRTLTVPLISPAPPKVGDVFLVGSPWRVGHTPWDW